MRSLIFLITTLIVLAFTAQSSLAETYSDEPPIGTYKTVIVPTADACTELCYADPKICRGSVAMQADITKPIIHCYLNDGLEQGSPFESTPPEPLDLNIALADFNNYRAENGLPYVKIDERLNAFPSGYKTFFLRCSLFYDIGWACLHIKTTTNS